MSGRRIRAGLSHGSPWITFPTFRADLGQADQVVDADSMSYNTLPPVSFVAKSYSSETCSNKIGKRASQRGDGRLKGGGGFLCKRETKAQQQGQLHRLRQSEG